MRNAKDRKLSESATGLPDVSQSVEMFLQRMVVKVIRKKQVDGYTKEYTECIITQAVKQPFSPEQLEVKAEGERSWKWYTLHSLTDLRLKTDDIVILHEVEYRVMEKLDFREYGYYEYHIVEGFQKDED